MGETQEERIMQFLEENSETVVGLREGSLLRVQDGVATLEGQKTARIFRSDKEPVEVPAGSGITELLLGCAGATAS
jgi:dipeptidase E